MEQRGRFEVLTSERARDEADLVYTAPSGATWRWPIPKNMGPLALFGLRTFAANYEAACRHQWATAKRPGPWPLELADFDAMVRRRFGADLR